MVLIYISIGFKDKLKYKLIEIVDEKNKRYDNC